MLAAAEAHYAAALQAALAPGATILLGPAPSVPAGASVQVLAEQLRLAPPSQDGDDRGAARHFTTQSWQGDGVTTSFALPPGALEVAEESRPRPASRASAATTTASTPARSASRGLRPWASTCAPCCSAPRPAASSSVGAASSRCACGPAPRPASTSSPRRRWPPRSRPASTCPTSPRPRTTGVRARLGRPIAFLVAVTRQRERVGDGERACVEIEFLLRGEVLLHVALGVPDPVDRIRVCRAWRRQRRVTFSPGF